MVHGFSWFFYSRMSKKGWSLLEEWNSNAHHIPLKSIMHRQACLWLRICCFLFVHSYDILTIMSSFSFLRYLFCALRSLFFSQNSWIMCNDISFLVNQACHINFIHATLQTPFSLYCSSIFDSFHITLQFFGDCLITFLV